MIAPARKFSILSMPNWRILEQSNPGGTSGLMYCEFMLTLYFFGSAGALPITGRAPKPTSAKRDAGQHYEHVRLRHGGLKKADREADFFFIG